MVWVTMVHGASTEVVSWQFVGIKMVIILVHLKTLISNSLFICPGGETREGIVGDYFL